jgi:hypothetical protein
MRCDLPASFRQCARSRGWLSICAGGADTSEPASANPSRHRQNGFNRNVAHDIPYFGPALPSDNETISCRPIGQLEAIPYPPDGQTREWWHRLKNALGTRSSAFVAASVQQLIAAARLPNSGISEVAVNASLAFIEGAKPRDELECALVIQMACTHSATMAVLSRVRGAHGGDRSVAAMASAAARLLRAYATQVEALRRLRNGGSQTVRVEHVHVNEGGQAIIGNVQRGVGGETAN